MNTLKPITPIAVGRASRHSLWRARHVLALVAAWLRMRWQRASLDHASRYLAGAADHADLERRMRALERCGGRPPC